MTLIARYFESESQVDEARQSLISAGYSSNDITVISPVAPSSSGTGEPAVKSAEIAAKAVMAGKLLGEDSGSYVSNQERGYSLLAVEAGFGRALLAGQILDRHDPIENASPSAEATEPYRLISERAAPLSDLLGWQTLSKNSGTLSGVLGFKTLTKNRSFLTSKLAAHDSSLSAKLGMPLLSNNAAPLSSMIGMSVKSGKSGEPWSRSMGFKMLSENRTPLSSFFGIPLISGQNDSRSYAPTKHRSSISKKAAPLSDFFGLVALSKNRQSFLSRMFPALSGPNFSLSAMFGMPLLSKNPAPLSSMLGMSVKSGKSGD